MIVIQDLIALLGRVLLAAPEMAVQQHAIGSPHGDLRALLRRPGCVQRFEFGGGEVEERLLVLHERPIIPPRQLSPGGAQIIAVRLAHAIGPFHNCAGMVP